jgi:hypothetical protein
MDILGYLFLSVAVMAIIALFAKILGYAFKTIVEDNND